jgi:hypothetical protein
LSRPDLGVEIATMTSARYWRIRENRRQELDAQEDDVRSFHPHSHSYF